MISERELLERLRELADVTESRGASADIERRLMESFTVRALQDEGSQWSIRWVPAIAITVALLLATTGLVWQTTPATKPSEQSIATSVSVENRSLDGFVPVPGASALPQLESGSVVRYELPLTTLRAYGLDIVPEPARLTVDADLLVGQDGYARAIRLTPAADAATHVDAAGTQDHHD